ncbi:hypothetical protein [Paenibacillus dendritiformis]|uniref:hypothetical protein n=2 Tax=Paenibacillus TaxID=44249 RepID=UPI0018CE5636|nr:hypothetical protein [Paenibacillus dendritiformis]
MIRKVFFLCLVCILLVPVTALAQPEKIVNHTDSYISTQPIDGKPYYTGETPPSFMLMNVLNCKSPKNTTYTCSGLTRDYLDTDKYSWNTLDNKVMVRVKNTQGAFSKDKIEIVDNYAKANWTGGSLITPDRITMRVEHLIKGSGLSCGVGFPFSVSCSTSGNVLTLTFPDEDYLKTSAATFKVLDYEIESPAILDSFSNVTVRNNINWKFGTNALAQFYAVSMDID